MKRILFGFLLLALFPIGVFAFDQKCISEYSSDAIAKDTGYHFLQTQIRDDIFFIQDNQILPAKAKDIITRDVYDYAIVSDVASLDINNNISAVQDDIPSTVIELSPLSVPDEVNLTLDFQTNIAKDTVNPIIQIQGRSYTVSISLDGQTFILIDETALSHNTFRFVRFTFPKEKGNHSNIILSTLRFHKNNPGIYIVKPIHSGLIQVYRGWVCDMQKLDSLRIEKEILSQKIQTDIPVSSLQYLQFKNLPTTGVDADGDSIIDMRDNCPTIQNPDQKDRNFDGIGDACSDDDHDSIFGEKDNCPTVVNPDQKDVNANGIGDACEFDTDKDSIPDGKDNCIHTLNPDQKDIDKDSIGDTCDNCRLYNPDQRDMNNNGSGDICEADEQYRKTNDTDKDGILDAQDNCPTTANPDQRDTDNDSFGDACDNCKSIQNPDQKDENKNTIGDFCEDADKDGIDGWRDNCSTVANLDQKDANNDGVGDMCSDADNDRVFNPQDNCSALYNPDQKDIDKDSIGDVCDIKDDRRLESDSKLFMIIGGGIALLFIAIILVLMSRISKPNTPPSL